MNQRQVLLLVEDDAGDAGLATEAAAWLGLKGEIAWVNNGAEAIAWLNRQRDERQSCPRLIVLDLNLPVMNGHEFLDRLRAGDACDRARVVVFSSSNRDDDRHRAERRGVTRYVVKPRTWDEYVVAFSEIVEEWNASQIG